MSRRAPQPSGDTIFNRSGSSNAAAALWLATPCSVGRYGLQLIFANVLGMRIDVSNVLQNYLMSVTLLCKNPLLLCKNPGRFKCSRELEVALHAL